MAQLIKELNNILTIISKHTKVASPDILNGGVRKFMDAHKIACYIVKEGFPHLCNDFTYNAIITRNTLYIRADNISERIKTDKDMRDIVNNIRTELGLMPIKVEEPKEVRKVVSHTKQLFGFDYTEEENLKRHLMISHTKKWFEKEYGYGAKPLKRGCVFTRE